MIALILELCIARMHYHTPSTEAGNILFKKERVRMLTANPVKTAPALLRKNCFELVCMFCAVRQVRCGEETPRVTVIVKPPP